MNFVLQERLVDEFTGREFFIFQFDGETREGFEVYAETFDLVPSDAEGNANSSVYPNVYYTIVHSW